MAEYDVFISYRSSDPQPPEITRFLEDNGVKCWIAPRDITPGVTYSEAIVNGINVSKIFMVFISKDSLESHDVLSEIDIAHRKKKIIIPVFIEKVSLSDRFGYYLNKTQWIDVFSDSPQQKENLLLTVRRFINQALEDKKKDEQEEKRRQEERNRKIASQKADLVRLAEDYKKKKSALSVDLNRIKSILSALSISKLKCPVCGSECNVDDDYCNECGWPVAHLDAIEETRYLSKTNNKNLHLHRELYKASQNTDKIESLAQQMERLERDLHNAEVEKSKLAKANEVLHFDLDCVRKSKDKTIHELRKELDQNVTGFKNLNTKISSLEADLHDAAIEKSKLAKANEDLHYDLDCVQKRESNTASTNDKLRKELDSKESTLNGFHRSCKAIAKTLNISLALITIVGLIISFHEFPWYIQSFICWPICSASLLTASLFSSKLSRTFLIVSTSFSVLLSSLIAFVYDWQFMFWITLMTGFIFAALIVVSSDSQRCIASNSKPKLWIFINMAVDLGLLCMSAFVFTPDRIYQLYQGDYDDEEVQAVEVLEAIDGEFEDTVVADTVEYAEVVEVIN